MQATKKYSHRRCDTSPLELHSKEFAETSSIIKGDVCHGHSRVTTIAQDNGHDSNEKSDRSPGLLINGFLEYPASAFSSPLSGIFSYLASQESRGCADVSI
jgi:hypothetical protein